MVTGQVPTAAFAEALGGEEAAQQDSQAKIQGVQVEPEAEDAATAVQAEPEPAPAPQAEVAPAPQDDRAARAGYRIEDGDYVLIQDKQDKDDSYSKVKGELKPGATLWANIYDYYDWVVTGKDGLTYQWMSSPKKSTSKADYAPIAGQTGQSLVITDDLARELGGRYIGVVVSDGTTELWEPTSSFGVPGPVQKPGAIKLSRVEMHRAGTKISGDVDAILHPGDTIEAVAITGGSSADGATNGTVVKEGVTYAWTLLPSRNAAAGEALGEGATVRLAEGDAVLGKYLRVEASTTEGSVAFVMGPIAPEGALRLANISIAVEGGGSVTDNATLIARPVLTAGKVPPAGSVTYEWQVAESASGPFEPIAGATGNRLELAKSHVGSYIRVVATAGGYNQVKATAGPVLDAQSAEAAKAALDGFTPQPVFGESQNVREIVQAKLDELGFAQAKVRVKSAETGAGGATVTSAEGADNGRVTFYYEDPEGDVPGSARIKVVFEISSRGTTAEWTRWITVRWDMARVAERLERLVDEELKASSLVKSEGGTADNATNSIEARKDLFLDGSLGTCADLTWSTSDSKVIGADGVIVRKQSDDAHARLTATARFNKAAEGEKAPQISKDFDVTVKSIDSDPTVEQVLDEALAKLPLKDMGTKEPIDPAAVTGDIQLPTTRSMGLKGVHKVKYEVVSGDGACSIYGYTLNVTRPAPGMPDAHAVLNVALTKKAGENLPQDVTRTRSIDLTVKALDTADIDRELDLMQRAKDGYAQALLGANDDPRSVTQSLDEFKQVRDDGNGGLVWARTSTEVEGMGIVPVSIDLSHPSEQWDKFRSSAPAVIESETLRLLKTPEYNTRVKITSCLSSEKYGDYYEKLKDDPSVDPAVLAKYRALSRQEVSAYYTVRGATGLDDPNAPKGMVVSARVTGLGEKTAGGVHAQEWIPLTEVTVEPGESPTAWDVFAGLLGRNGYTYSMEKRGVPYSITTPDGTRTLAMSAGEPWSFWSFRVNGEYAEDYANAHYVSNGDVIELVYVDGSGEVLPENDIEITPAAPRPNWESPWPNFTTGTRPTDAKVPTGDVEQAWVDVVGTVPEGSYGVPNVSDPIVVGDYLYVASADRLIMKDRVSGKTVREAKLAASIDSTARMVYAGGIIVVPVHGGRLQALTADALATVWLTQALPTYTTESGFVVEQQSLGTLTVHDGYVYAGTSDGSSGKGYLTCVNLRTGAIRWQREDKGGYYWAGAAATGSHLVIGDDTGAVVVRDATTGEEVSRVGVGAPVRSTVVQGDDASTFFAVSTDGVMHRLSLSENGELKETGSVKFAKTSTGTPALVDGKLVVGGQSDQFVQVSKYMKAYYGLLAVIDAKTLAVDAAVTTVDGKPLLGKTGAQAASAEVKSTPVVSVQGGQTYVYFTANCNPGGMYRYRLGDADASLVYTPAPEHQQFCMYSIAVGPDGTLYYKNDSGALFAIKGVGGQEPGGGDGGNGGGNGGNGGGNGGGETGGNGGGETGGNGGGETGGNGGDQGGSDGQGGDSQSGNENRPGNGGTDSGAGNNSSGTGSTGSGNVTGDGTGGGSNNGPGPSSATGAVSAGKKPLKPQYGQKQDVEKTGEKKSDSKKGAKDEKGDSPSRGDASSVGDSSAANRTAGSSASMARGPLATILPVLGIAVGAIGLGAIAFWVFRRRV